MARNCGLIASRIDREPAAHGPPQLGEHPMQEHAKSQATAKMIEDALAERFGETCPVDADLQAG